MGGWVGEFCRSACFGDVGDFPDCYFWCSLHACMVRGEDWVGG